MGGEKGHAAGRKTRNQCKRTQRCMNKTLVGIIERQLSLSIQRIDARAVGQQLSDALAEADGSRDVQWADQENRPPIKETRERNDTLNERKREEKSKRE